MAFTLQSDFTFSIPRDIQDVDGSNTARIKRTSADGVVPVVLTGSNNLNLNELKVLNYICYKTGATLDTIEKRRIESIEDSLVLETGYVYVDSTDKNKIIGVGTSFITDVYAKQRLSIDGVVYTVKTITNDTTIILYEYITLPLSTVSVKFYSIDYLITLMNPLGAHWNAFPTTDNLCMQSFDDNVRFLNDNSVECYYRVQSNSTSQLVFDIDYTPDKAIDLKAERSSYRYEVTRERDRVEDIFNESSYIDEAKDTSSTITQNVYTWANVGISRTISLRHEFNITLVDQLIKIRLYPSDMNFATGDTTTILSDWTLKIDVREDTLGKRYNTNFVTV